LPVRTPASKYLRKLIPPSTRVEHCLSCRYKLRKAWLLINRLSHHLSAASRISKGSVKFNSKSPQKSQKFNQHKGAVNRNHFSQQPATVNEYFVPPLSPQIGNKTSSFPPPAAPYQQYGGPVPHPQAFPQQAAPYQPNQQFSVPGPQHPYNQQPPQQPYGGPQVPPRYGPGYQAPPYNQYQQPNAPPQFPAPTYPNAPQQFGPPQHVTPVYPVQNNSFAGNLSSAPPFQTHPRPWNNAPPVPPSRAPPTFQHQPRNFSDPGFNSATPGFQNQSYQVSRERTGSQSYQQTPQTPASNVGSAQQPTPRLLQSSPAIAPNQSKVSSSSSTPYARLGALDNDVIKEIKPRPLEEIEEAKTSVKKEGEEQQREDGEVPEEGEREEESEDDDEDAVLNWEYMAIFLEPPRLETVALAQPLSTNFGMTPVPLLDPNSKNSISRYARKDNLKEFIRPITMAPQWSYIKDDPAFAELGLDCQLIPLSDVPTWVAARHGSTIVVDDPSQPSRKRSRSNSSEQGPQEDKMEQDDANVEVAVPEEVPETHAQGPPSKRIKNELAEAEKLAAPTTVHVTSPFNVGRAGTPCLTTEDDAWAPDPGEVAGKPMSPTEMLLASLGVTGSPKPPKQASPPPPVDDNQQTQHDTNTGPPPNQAINQPAVQAPTPTFQGSQTSNANYGGSQPQSTFAGPPSNPPFAGNQNGPHQQQQYGAPTNQPYTNGPQSQQQFAPPPNNYQNGAPVNTGFGNPQFPNPQYGQPAPQQNGPPQYGPAVPQQNGSQQYRPPMSSGFGNGAPVNTQYGAGPQGSHQYNNMPPQSVPYNGQQYNQAPQYNGAPAGPYGQPGNTQFSNGPPTQQQYGPPHANPQFAPGPPAQQQYGPPQQGTPQFAGAPTPQQYGAPQPNPQFGNGPPNQQQYGGAPQGNVAYSNGPPAQQQYGVAPQNNSQFSNGPPPQQQYGGPQGSSQFGNAQPNQQQYGPTPHGNAQFPNAQHQQQYGGPQGHPQYGNAPPVQQSQSYDAAPQNGVFRQDSGYASARGSYSNGPGPNAFNNENKPPSQDEQIPPNENNQPQPQQGPTTPPLKIEIPSTTSPEEEDSDNESLSPTSLEILGKLLPNRKLSSGRKAESKLKRPAPVVEAAYRYVSITQPAVPFLC